MTNGRTFEEEEREAQRTPFRNVVEELGKGYDMMKFCPIFEDLGDLEQSLIALNTSNEDGVKLKAREKVGEVYFGDKQAHRTWDEKDVLKNAKIAYDAFLFPMVDYFGGKFDLERREFSGGNLNEVLDRFEDNGLVTLVTNMPLYKTGNKTFDDVAARAKKLAEMESIKRIEDAEDRAKKTREYVINKVNAAVKDEIVGTDAQAYVKQNIDNPRAIAYLFNREYEKRKEYFIDSITRNGKVDKALLLGLVKASIDKAREEYKKEAEGLTNSDASIRATAASRVNDYRNKVWTPLMLGIARALYEQDKDAYRKELDKRNPTKDYKDRRNQKLNEAGIGAI